MSESDKQPFKMSDSQKCGNRKVWKKKLLILVALAG